MQKSVGSLTIIIGPMCSGKSTRNIEWLASHYDAVTSQIGGPVPLYITHTNDKQRAKDNNIAYSHASRFKGLPSNIDSISTERLSDVDVSDRIFIGIDEGQFYEDLVPTVLKWIDDGKQLTISSLVGDFNMRSFGDITDLIPHADDVIFTKAICHYCLKDFKNSEKTMHSNDLHTMRASFTVKISGDLSKQIEVGDASEKNEIEKPVYKPTCRKHFKNSQTIN